MNYIRLYIPAGYDILATVENIKLFFQTHGENGKDVVRSCIPLMIPIPKRLVSKEVEQLKEKICSQLLDPSEWVHKELTVFVFSGGEIIATINLNADRKIV